MPAPPAGYTPPLAGEKKHLEGVDESGGWREMQLHEKVCIFKDLDMIRVGGVNQHFYLFDLFNRY